MTLLAANADVAELQCFNRVRRVGAGVRCERPDTMTQMRRKYLFFKHYLYCVPPSSRPAASRFCWRTRAWHTNGRADSTEPQFPGALTARGKRQVLVLV
jgi:hypothetical protein